MEVYINTGNKSVLVKFKFNPYFSALFSGQYLHVFINEVTILVPVLNDSKHTFAIYTAERTKQRWPIRLAAATELEMHDWVRRNINHGKLTLNNLHCTL